MILKPLETNGLRFQVRPGSSDEKTIREVIDRHAYERKTFKIKTGETWLDLGGNVGAFTVLAAARGCDVTVYEPDPTNIKLLKGNLEVNGLKATVKACAVVHDDRPGETLNLWPDGQSWRNSIVRNKKGTMPMTVSCANFFKIATPEHCVKMDIEGAEIAILEAWPPGFRVKKLVFEYSFDVDPNVERLRNILKILGREFEVMHYSSQIDRIAKWNFFPPCTMVHCL